MKYNENFYVVIHGKDQRMNDIALKVKGATYSKDKRLFIHRFENNYQLTDKKTGLFIVIARTIKKLEEKYNEKVALYNKVVNGKLYNKFESHLNEILREGEILIEDRG